MKSIVFAVFVAVVGLKGIVEATNYCAASLCPGTTNIGCNNTGAFASTCPPSKKLITMTAAIKQAILKRHNNKRNTLAAGKLPGFKPAVKMATMRWNEELAQLAVLNAKRCVFAHDSCHNTDKFKFSGQNIAETWWSAGSPAILSVILPQIDAWWSEYKGATMAQLNSYPTNPSNVIGHFSVMTAQKNTALGCAAIQYLDPAQNNWTSLTLVCNYARTNIVGYKMYTSGTTASKCTTGTNPNFTALCSLSEPYNVNSV